jgi:adenosylmethionine-8-amino-7-oxononanoate aminotransferase
MARSAAQTREEVKRRFTGRDADVERAFRDSPTFRGLCGDYLACVAALEHWQAATSEEAPRRAAEYAELLGELTQEVERHLRYSGNRSMRA